jgi:hypothetical protein
MFFEDKKIYSYGYHYLLAMIHTANSGRQIVLVNSQGYSVSTAKHTGHVYRAISHFEHVNVPCPNPHTEELHKVNLDHLYKTVTGLLKRIPRARVYGATYLNQAYEAFDNLKCYLAFFDVQDAQLSEQQLNSIVSWTEDGLVDDTLREKISQREQQNKERETEHEQEAIAKFKRHEGLYTPGNSAYLRLSKDRQRIESSKGESAGLDQAGVLYKMIKRGQSVAGFELNGYKVNFFEGGILRIGCHSIPESEIDEIASTLGW